MFWTIPHNLIVILFSPLKILRFLSFHTTQTRNPRDSCQARFNMGEDKWNFEDDKSGLGNRKSNTKDRLHYSDTCPQIGQRGSRLLSQLGMWKNWKQPWYKGQQVKWTEGMSSLVEILRKYNEKGENPRSRCGRQWWAEGREAGQMAQWVEGSEAG